MSLESLSNWLETQPDKGRYVMLLAWLLGEPAIKQHTTWEVLRKRFNKHHRDDILEYCEIDACRLLIERIVVNDPDLFIAYISAMLRCKIIDGTYENTADRIDLVFRTGREISTICNHLSEAEDVYFDICEAVRETKKKYKKN